MIRRRHIHWYIVSAVAIVAVIAATIAGGAITALGPTVPFRNAVSVRVHLIPAVHRGSAVLLPTAPRPITSVSVTATYLSNCQTYGTQCRWVLLQRINFDRAQVGVGPLILDSPMSWGALPCIGAVGHSRHMASVGAISHDQFAADVCAPFYRTAGENVGEAGGMSKWGAITAIDDQMMAEPGWTPGCQSSHICNLLYAGYSKVGIGFASKNGVLFLTEDFVG